MKSEAIPHKVREGRSGEFKNGRGRGIRATSHTSQGGDHNIVRAQKKVSKGRPNTPPKSCSAVTDPQV